MKVAGFWDFDGAVTGISAAMHRALSVRPQIAVKEMPLVEHGAISLGSAVRAS